MDEINIKSQLRKGILEYCILLCLCNTARAYPSDLLEKLKSADLLVVEGTIYTLLNRLRKEGKLTYEWEESPYGPPRKYYSITEQGRQTLRLFEKAWNEVSASVDYIYKTSMNPDNTLPLK